MDESNRDISGEKNLLRRDASHLQPVFIAPFYGLLALGNFLLYGPTPFEVLGFTDDPISWWAIATVLFTITFCVFAIRIECQRRLYSANLHQQPRPVRRSTIMLVVLTILFTVPNVFIAFLHVNGIRAGFAYWGQVRAAYEVPFFHLLPMLLLLYWWLSSYHWRRQVRKE